ncbi:MAG: cytochrome b N-terminal domain-containing protein [Mucispirillum sp.]|nr:cytochrome b N-terminal domain-containing protein [Mucispirillum sp.]
MFKEFIKHLFPRVTLKKNLRFTYTLCLGGLSFTAFIMLVISGILLAVYYIPEPSQAYDSIIFIEENVTGGKYIRNLHRFSSNAFLILMFLHILRVILTGAFLSRKYNWVIGLFLLFLSIFTGYTGYLLPMDQLSYWATQTGAELIKILPFGDYIYNIIIPDTIGGRLSLIRFYALHIIILPFLISTLSFIHFFRVRRDKGVLPYL